VRDRLRGREIELSGEREHFPAALLARPVLRRADRLRDDPVPAVREPPLRILVSARFDELEELAVRHRTRGELERLREDLVAGSFVVEREPGAVVTDRVEAAFEPEEPQRRRGDRRGRGALPVAGPQRIQREEVLQVGQHQLLVLLLVVEPELERGRRLAVEQARDSAVDVRAVLEDFPEVGSRHLPAHRPGHALADRVVVGIEEEIEARVEAPVAGVRAGEDERLEEPAGVREVPPDRARVRHRLGRAVLGRERFRDALRRAPHRVVPRGEALGGDRSGSHSATPRASASTSRGTSRAGVEHSATRTAPASGTT
jgi:hypothetical protein